MRILSGCELFRLQFTPARSSLRARVGIACRFGCDESFHSSGRDGVRTLIVVDRGQDDFGGMSFAIRSFRREKLVWRRAPFVSFEIVPETLEEHGRKAV